MMIYDGLCINAIKYNMVKVSAGDYRGIVSSTENGFPANISLICLLGIRAPSKINFRRERRQENFCFA